MILSPQQNSLWHCFLFSGPRFRIPFQTVYERTISSFLNYLYVVPRLIILWWCLVKIRAFMVSMNGIQAVEILRGNVTHIWRWRCCCVAGCTEVCVTLLLPRRCQPSSQPFSQPSSQPSSQCIGVLSLMSFVSLAIARPSSILDWSGEAAVIFFSTSGVINGPSSN